MPEPARPAPEAPYAKPLPSPDPETKPYWEALRQHKLLYQRCSDCGTKFAPYQAICPACWSDEVRDCEACGLGRIYTFSIVHRAPMPAFRADLPYAVAIVELAEGVYITTNIVDCPADEIRIGMDVEVTFDAVTPQITLPKFRPVRTKAS
jgi:hypothetical protein